MVYTKFSIRGAGSLTRHFFFINQFNTYYQMTLKSSHVTRLFSYFSKLYQDELRELETERVNKIKESDEYKETVKKIEEFFTTINYTSIEYTPYSIAGTVHDLYKNYVDTWERKELIDLKLNAILATLPDSLAFEEIVKLVDEKLNFEEIINNN